MRPEEVERLLERALEHRERKRAPRQKRRKRPASESKKPSARKRDAEPREVSMREFAELMTEEQLYELLREAALFAGWRIYHTYDSRRSYAGFPDVVLVRPPRLLFVELKREKGQLTDEQKQWLADLAACGCEVRVWRPTDWWSNAILAELGYATETPLTGHSQSAASDARDSARYD